MIATQNDKKRDAMERAAEAAALAAAACANAEKNGQDDDEDDPLDKYMETIAKEVRGVRGNAATIVSVKSSSKPVKNEVKRIEKNSIALF